MTSKEDTHHNEKTITTLEEICENTRAIRRVVNRILDHLHEAQERSEEDDDPYSIDWEDLDDYDDMYS